MTRTILVPDTLTGERVDKALASLDPSLSRTMIQRLIKTGAVFRMASPNAVFPAADSTPVNDPASAYRQIFSCTEKILSEGLFELRIPPAIPSEIIAEAIDLSIVFEDDHLLVVNKPAGMSTHPGAGPDGHKGTLVNALLHHCRGTLSGIGGVIRPGIVHRLDKGTSGLLVVAKRIPPINISQNSSRPAQPPACIWPSSKVRRTPCREKLTHPLVEAPRFGQKWP